MYLNQCVKRTGRRAHLILQADKLFSGSAGVVVEQVLRLLQLLLGPLARLPFALQGGPVHAQLLSQACLHHACALLCPPHLLLQSIPKHGEVQAE